MQFPTSDIYLDQILNERTRKFAHTRIAQAHDFARVHESNLNLVIWRRTVLPSLAQWLDHHTSLRFQQSQFEVTIDTADAKLQNAVELHWHEPLPGRRLFIADLKNLVGIFANISGANRFGARLELNRKRADSRFHMDDVPLRLLTTYAGQGTEWLDESDVDRRALNLPSSASVVCRNPANVQHIPRFAVAVFKGRTYPGNGAEGLVHRSPPAEPAEEGPRLLFSLDPIS